MRRLVAIFVLGSLSLSAPGQNLTRAQEGRVEVAKCYANCTVSTATGAVAVTRFILDGFDGVWDFPLFLLSACLLIQEGGKNIDACRATCLDVEAAYGYRSGHVRARFNRIYLDSVRELRASGLWLAWNNYPRPGTAAFSRACSRLLESASRSASKTAQVHAEEAPNFDPTAMQNRLREVLESEIELSAPPLHDPDFWE